VIKELERLRRRLVVYPAGPRLTTKDGIEVMPLADFVELLARDELW
jgi:hypothetical protein